MAQSIGDIAMGILANDLKKKGVEPIREAVEPGKDLSKVKLSDNTYNLIMEQSFGIRPTKKAAPVQETKVFTPVEQPKKVNRTPDQIVAEFTEIVVKSRALLAEMTSCGMIGIGPGKVAKKKKKLKSKAY